jgi:hypothetical protein
MPSRSALCTAPGSTGIGGGGDTFTGGICTALGATGYDAALNTDQDPYAPGDDPALVAHQPRQLAGHRQYQGL